MYESLVARFKNQAPDVDFWSLRLMEENRQGLSVRQDIPQPISSSRSFGLMLTVVNNKGIGYAATSDTSNRGLRMVSEQACRFARMSAKHSLFDGAQLSRPSRSGNYQTPVTKPWESAGIDEKIEWLTQGCKALKTGERIVYWLSWLRNTNTTVRLVTSDDIDILQQFNSIQSGLMSVASEGSRTQTRTGGGAGTARQGGLEQLDSMGFFTESERISEEAIALLSAPECPTGKKQVLLAPDQMMLQIHESIGHPLELDRILGDERNYAGTSFVTLDMFGNYQYGSELLNITFDPTVSNEMATYQYDDDGSEASREYIIKEGILLTPLGGATSQSRAGVNGVANARADSWRRPPIDRMANLNLEPGDLGMKALIESVEDGVLMKTNSSWSIDDSRNKFQFGCEYGQLIRDGELKGLVRNPNYRGISASFWRNLAAVGDRSTFDVLGTPNCGKGEPNQVVSVGHASPACVFRDVDVFGGETSQES